MKVRFISAECAPFSVSGGLGEVVSSLPKALSRKGVKVDVVLPLYRITDLSGYNTERVLDLEFDLSWRRTGCSVYKTVSDGITYFFIENSYYFDRNGIYGEYDDGERFAFFSRAALEFTAVYSEKPQILHLNDWQTALCSVYIKTIYKDDKRLSGIKTVYTIHNVEYQGIFDRAILGDVFGIGADGLDILDFKGNLNLMKGGIVASDIITTVSPNYSYELAFDFFSFGLSEVINENRGKLYGIINGIDYGVFSPKVERAGLIPYDKDSFKEGKAENKRALLSELKMNFDKERPLLVMVTRLASQKGLDLLIAIADELLLEKVDLIILGTGEERILSELRNIEKRCDNLKILGRYDRDLALKLYSAGDIFLMPSKSEPCGISQMIACSFGCVPIVRNVGGLHDTIIPYGEEGASGFRFDNYNAHELLFTVKKALMVYENSEEWCDLVLSSMNKKFDWENSAKEYISIYKKLADKKRKNNGKEK